MKRIITGAILALLPISASAADFFSTAEPDELFTIGARVGVNTSNRTINSGFYDYEFQSWGTGFTAGAVASINIRNYISVEPGFFFESRSGHSTFTSPAYLLGDEVYYVTQSAHRHTYNFTIPVVASLRMNITDDLRWHVDFGPYVSFLLKSKLENKELISTRPDLDNSIPFDGKAAPVDFGFKMGTSFEIIGRYEVGIHYEAGAVKAYKDYNLGDGLKRIYGGRTKAWSFTLGYNF